MHTTEIFNIGITYDLKTDYLARGYSEEQAAEFDSIETIEAIEDVILKMGFQADRIGNIQALVSRIAKGHRWDLVFNICEGEWGSAREAQVPALLDAYQIPHVFSDASVLTLALNKFLTKELVRKYGVPTAESFLIHRLSDLENCHLPFPLFLKPSEEGSSKGIHADCKVSNSLELQKTARRIFEQCGGPILIERYLPGAEFTVGVQGEGSDAEVFGVMEVLFKNKNLPPVYGYETKRAYADCIEYRLPEGEVSAKVAKVALDAWRIIGCRDAGRIDVRMDADGVPNFIEVNPLAGLHPQNSDLVIMANLMDLSYFDLVSGIIEQALARLGMESLQTA